MGRSQRMPLSEMDYVEELHAQAAAKQRERQQAKLLERAENLQHMAALAGDAADSDLDSLLRQQGKEIGNAARRLGVDMDELKQQAGRARSPAAARSLAVVQPARLQPGGGVRPTATGGRFFDPPAPQSRHGGVYDQARPQCVARGQPTIGGECGAGHARNRRDEAYEAKRREFKQRQVRGPEQPAPPPVHPGHVPSSSHRGGHELTGHDDGMARDGAPPAAALTADSGNNERREAAPSRREEVRRQQREYAAALNEQQREGREQNIGRCNGDGGDLFAAAEARRRQHEQEHASTLVAVNAACTDRRHHQRQYAAALETQVAARHLRDQESRENRLGLIAGGDTGGGSGGGNAAPLTLESKRRQQQEYTAALDDQVAARQRGASSGAALEDELAGQALPVRTAHSDKRWHQQQYAAALEGQVAARQLRDQKSRENRLGLSEGDGGSAVDGGGGADDAPGRVGAAAERRRQQQEYAAALEAQIGERQRDQRRGALEQRAWGAGDADGVAGGRDAADSRRRQQQEYAAALEEQLQERQQREQESRERRLSFGAAVIAGDGSSAAARDAAEDFRRRQQQEYAAALEEQMAHKDRGGRGGRDRSLGGGRGVLTPPGQASPPKIGGEFPAEARRRQQQEYAAALEGQQRERQQREQESRERRLGVKGGALGHRVFLGGADLAVGHAGSAVEAEAVAEARRRQQQEYAAALEAQVEEKRRQRHQVDRRASRPGAMAAGIGFAGESPPMSAEAQRPPPGSFRAAGAAARGKLSGLYDRGPRALLEKQHSDKMVYAEELAKQREEVLAEPLSPWTKPASNLATFPSRHRAAAGA